MNVQCIVNGFPYVLDMDPDSILVGLRLRALEAGGITGRPPSDFDIRNDKGEWLAPWMTMAESGLEEGSVLWVTIRIAAGGSNKINWRKTHQRVRSDRQCNDSSAHFLRSCARWKRRTVRRLRHLGWIRNGFGKCFWNLSRISSRDRKITWEETT